MATEKEKKAFVRIHGPRPEIDDPNLDLIAFDQGGSKYAQFIANTGQPSTIHGIEYATDPNTNLAVRRERTYHNPPGITVAPHIQFCQPIEGEEIPRGIAWISLYNPKGEYGQEHSMTTLEFYAGEVRKAALLARFDYRQPHSLPDSFKIALVDLSPEELEQEYQRQQARLDESTPENFVSFRLINSEERKYHIWDDRTQMHRKLGELPVNGKYHSYAGLDFDLHLLVQNTGMELSTWGLETGECLNFVVPVLDHSDFHQRMVGSWKEYLEIPTLYPASLLQY